VHIYLAGAIEHAPDRGRTWRAELTPFLHSLGHEVYDPVLDEMKSLTDEERLNFRGWKTTDLSRYRVALQKIIAWDLDIVEHTSDAVIAYWDIYAARGAGTQAEITLAHRRRKPVYLVSAMPVPEVSGWLLGCANEVFGDFEALRQFLSADPTKRQTRAGP